MLIHLTPRMYACRTTQPCTLIDLTCEELGLHLRGGKEITARRPFPNKNYLVACRKVGQKAMQGLLIESDTFLNEFTVVTRWADEAGDILTHRLTYQVLDSDFDTVTDEMVTWGKQHSQVGDFGSRWPDCPEHSSPAHTKPRMEAGRPNPKSGNVSDTYGDTGHLVERVEVFRVPTIERERLVAISKLDGRMPGLDTAFVAHGAGRQSAALVS